MKDFGYFVFSGICNTAQVVLSTFVFGMIGMMRSLKYMFLSLLLRGKSQCAYKRVLQALCTSAFFVVMGGCDVATVDGEKLDKLDDQVFITDDSFAPRVTSIEPYEFCTLNISQQPSNNCRDSEKIKNQVNFGGGALRFKITFDKPVYFDKTTLGDLQFNNLTFFDLSARTQRFTPLESISFDIGGERVTRLREVDNPDTSKAYFAYVFVAEEGYIKPLVDGEFSLTVPTGQFYSKNPSGKNVYNTPLTAYYTMDSTSPNISVSFSVSEMNPPEKIMSPSASSEDGISKNYSNIVMSIDYDEQIIPESDISTLLQNGKFFRVVCTGCQGIPYAGGKAPVAGGDGSGVEYIGPTNPPENSIHAFRFTENDISGDYMNKLAGAQQIDFEILKNTIRDIGGNLNSQTLVYSVRVDSQKPEIEKINVRVKGLRNIPSANAINRSLSEGDKIIFDVVFTEDIKMQSANNNYLEMELFGFLRQIRLAEEDRSQIDVYNDSWTFEYIVQLSDGNNAVNSNVGNDATLDIAGQQFSGNNVDKESGSQVASWESDVPLYIGMEAADIVDRAGLTLDSVESIRFDQGTRVENSALLHYLHMDAVQPEIWQGSIEAFSQYASGENTNDINVRTNTLSNGDRLVIAIPFSEPIMQGASTVAVDFASTDGTNLETATIAVRYCTDLPAVISECNDARGAESLLYSKEYTQALQASNVLGQYANRTLAFVSGIINDGYGGIRSIVVEDITWPGGSTADYTDLSGNYFNSESLTASGFRVNRLIQMNIDGGPFGISSISVMEKNDQTSDQTSDEANYDVVVLEQSQRRRYNIADNVLYIGVFSNQDILGDPVSGDAKLTIRIRDVDGVAREVSTQNFVQQENSKNLLVFTFDIVGNNTGQPFEDFDGIEIVAMELINEDKFKNENRTTLNTQLRSEQVSDVFAQLIVDGRQPACTDSWLTTNADGSKPSANVLYYGAIPGGSGSYVQSLFFAVQCDSELTYNSIQNKQEIVPHIPVAFGDYYQKFRYAYLSDGGKRIVYVLPLQLGMQPGSSKQIVVGATDTQEIEWYMEDDVRKGSDPSDHNFFVDIGGNTLNKNFALENNHLAQMGLVLPIDQTPSTQGIVVNVNPYPVLIEYSEKSTYKDAYTQNNLYYLGLDSPNNIITFSIDYGIFFEDEQQTVSLLSDSGTQLQDLQGDLINSDNDVVAQFSATEISGNKISFAAQVEPGYADSNVQKEAKNYRTLPSVVPYAQFSLEHDNEDGTPGEVVTVNVPISRTIRDRIYQTSVNNADDLADLRISSTRPVLFDDPDNAIAVYYDAPGDGVRVIANSNNDEAINFGDIYIALAYTKPIDEGNLSNTYVDMAIERLDNEGSVQITPVDSDLISFVERSNLDNVFGDQKNVIVNNMLFYKFTFDSNVYAGRKIIINPNNDDVFVLDKNNDESADIVDIYGTSHTKTNPGRIGKEVELSARSSVASLQFSEDFYRFGDTATLTLVTDGRIDYSQSSIPSDKQLAIRAQLRVDENNSNEARDVFLVASNFSDSSTQTSITFTYTFDSVADQYDSDITADMGFVARGSVLLCDSGVITSDTGSNCVKFATNHINADGAQGSPASLVLGGYNPAAINTVLPAFATKFDSVGLIGSGIWRDIEYQKNGSSNRQIWNPSVRLEAGDKIFFTMSAKLQNEAKGSLDSATNSLQTATGSTIPDLRFTLYNGESEKIEDRRATYVELVPNQNPRSIVFEYTVESGDLVNLFDDDGNAVDYIASDGAVRQASDIVITFDSDNVFTQAGQVIAAFEDVIYQNSLRSFILDEDTNNVIERDFTADGSEIIIDTRPYVVGITSDSTGEFNKGSVISFSVEFSAEVEASNVGVLVDFQGLKDQTADLATTQPSNKAMLRFSVTVPETAGSGNVSVTKIAGTQTTNSYIRKQGTNFAANRNTLEQTTLVDVYIDNDIPLIRDVDLQSAQATYTKESTDRTIDILLTFSKAVTIDVPSNAQPYFDAVIDVKDGTTTTGRFLYNGGSQTAQNSLLFSLAVDSLGDNIQDYNGMQVSANGSNHIILNGATIRDDVGNNASTTFDSSSDSDPTRTIKTIIEEYETYIDTSAPTITSIEHVDEAGNVITDNVEYNIANPSDKTLRFRVSFDEKVNFSTATPEDFVLNLRVGDDDVDARFNSGASGANTGLESYIFTLSTDPEYFDSDGIALQAFAIANGATVHDVAGQNLITDLPTNADISNVRIDTIVPRVESIELADLTYALGATVIVEMQFSEDVTIDGAPIVRVDFIDGATKTTREFTYVSMPDKRSARFRYIVASNDKASQIQIGSQLGIGGSDIIADLFGNPVGVTLSPVPSVEDRNIDGSVSVLIDEVTFAVKRSAQSSFTEITDSASTTLLQSGDAIQVSVLYADSDRITADGAALIELVDANGNTIMLDLTTDISSDDNILTFAVDPVPLQRDAKNGLRVRPNIDGGTVEKSAGGAADRNFAGKISIDADNDNILDNIAIDTQKPILSQLRLSSDNALVDSSVRRHAVNDNHTIRMDIQADEALLQNNFTLKIDGNDVTNLTVDDLGDNNAATWQLRVPVDTSWSEGELSFELGVADENGNSVAVASTTDGSVIVYDNTAPQLQSQSTAISTIDASVEINFNEDVTVDLNVDVNQSIRIQQQGASDVINLASYRVQERENRIIFTFPSQNASGQANFLSGQRYSITLPSGVIIDLAGNDYAGTTSWVVDAQTNVALDAALYIPDRNIIRLAFNQSMRLIDAENVRLSLNIDDSASNPTNYNNDIVNAYINAENNRFFEIELADTAGINTSTSIASFDRLFVDIPSNTIESTAGFAFSQADIAVNLNVPFVSIARLRMIQNGRWALTSEMFEVLDRDSEDSEITVTFSNVTNGSFEEQSGGGIGIPGSGTGIPGGGTGTPGGETGADQDVSVTYNRIVNAGESGNTDIDFSHDATTNSPTFDYEVQDNDGNTTSGEGDAMFGYIPHNDANLVLHLNAGDPNNSGALPSNGDVISTWRDIAGNADGSSGGTNKHQGTQAAVVAVADDQLTPLLTFAQQLESTDATPDARYCGNGRGYILPDSNPINRTSGGAKTYALHFRTANDIDANQAGSSPLDMQVIYSEGGVSNGMLFGLYKGNLYFGMKSNPNYFHFNLGKVYAATDYVVVVVLDAQNSGVHANNTLRVYLNGSLAGTVSNYQPLTAHTGGTVGVISTSLFNPIHEVQISEAVVVASCSNFADAADIRAHSAFTGRIGDVLQWNRVFSAEEVTNITNYLAVRRDINLRPLVDVDGDTTDSLSYVKTIDVGTIVSVADSGARVVDSDSQSLASVVVTVSDDGADPGFWRGGVQDVLYFGETEIGNLIDKKEGSVVLSDGAVVRYVMSINGIEGDFDVTFSRTSGANMSLVQAQEIVRNIRYTYDSTSVPDGYAGNIARGKNVVAGNYSTTRQYSIDDLTGDGESGTATLGAQEGWRVMNTSGESDVLSIVEIRNVQATLDGTGINGSPVVEIFSIDGAYADFRYDRQSTIAFWAVVPQVNIRNQDIVSGAKIELRVNNGALEARLALARWARLFTEDTNQENDRAITLNLDTITASEDANDTIRASSTTASGYMVSNLTFDIAIQESHNSVFGADNAVDGDDSTSTNVGGVSTKPKWLAVDLGRGYIIDTITVVNNTGVAAEVYASTDPAARVDWMSVQNASFISEVAQQANTRQEFSVLDKGKQVAQRYIYIYSKDTDSNANIVVSDVEVNASFARVFDFYVKDDRDLVSNRSRAILRIQ